MPPRPALLALLVLAALPQAGCKRSAAEAASPAPRAVRLQAARPPRTGHVLRASGTLHRAHELPLSFRVPGQMLWLGVDRGDRITAGQVLAAMDATAYAARLRQALAEYDRAARDAGRFAATVGNGDTSRQRYDAGLAARDAARAIADAAAYDVSSARLVAPVSGIVLARAAQAGEVLQPGQPVLTVADSQSPMVLRVALSDQDAARLALDGTAEVAGPDGPIQGRISRIGALAATDTATVETEITLPETPRLRLGQVLRAQINLPGRAATAQRIPAEALLEADGDHGFVMRYDARSGTARRCKVGFAGFDGDDALVTGLAPRAQVITAGAGLVADGEAVAPSGGA